MDINQDNMIKVSSAVMTDTVFANMSYLEPRKVLILQDEIKKETEKYFKNTDLLNNTDAISLINQSYDLFLKDKVGIQNKKLALIDLYETYIDNKSIIFENISVSEMIGEVIQDLELLIKRTIAEEITKNRNLNEQIIVDAKNYLLSSPKPKLNKVISLDEDKELAYELMKRQYENFVPVGFHTKEMKFTTENREEIDFSYDKGWFDFGDSSTGLKECSFLAGYLKNENPKKLYISFRGTEAEAAPMVSQYMLKDYPNMKRHFSRMEKVLDEVIKKEIEKNGGKLEISFVGHSLGAAQAELAMKKYKNEDNVKYTATLIANPGSENTARTLIDTLDKIDYKLSDKIKNLKNCEQNLFNDACKITAQFAKKLNYGFKTYVLVGAAGFGAFLNLSKGLFKERDDNRLGVWGSAIKKGFNSASQNKIMKAIGVEDYIEASKFLSKKIARYIEPKSIEILESLQAVLYGKPLEDDRIISIRHDQDPVPKFGSLVTKSKKNNRFIINATDKTKESLNELDKLVKTTYHCMNGYIANTYTNNFQLESNSNITSDRILQMRKKYSGVDSGLNHRPAFG